MNKTAGRAGKTPIFKSEIVGCAVFRPWKVPLLKLACLLRLARRVVAMDKSVNMEAIVFRQHIYIISISEPK